MNFYRITILDLCFLDLRLLILFSRVILNLFVFIHCAYLPTKYVVESDIRVCPVCFIDLSAIDCLRSSDVERLYRVDFYCSV